MKTTEQIEMIHEQNIFDSFIAIVWMGDVAALARSHMNGSLPFEKTIEQTIWTIPLAPNTIAAATLEDH